MKGKHMRFGEKFSIVPAALLTLLFAIILVSPPARGDLKKGKDPRILWAFGAMQTSSRQPRAVPVTSGMVLRSGDKLKMMIRIRDKCFVYLIHKDSQGNFSMLFPYSPRLFDVACRVDRNYYVPEGDAWFQLDTKTGKETFYLIASDQRLLDIEYTYQQYVSSKGAKDKQNLAGEMLSELDGLSLHHFASSSRAGESSGQGNLVRGFERAEGADPTDITGLAREISFNNIYSQTFIIDHRSAGESVNR